MGGCGLEAPRRAYMPYSNLNNQFIEGNFNLNERIISRRWLVAGPARWWDFTPLTISVRLCEVETIHALKENI